MCKSLQTKEGQEWIPDFLKDTSGTSVTIPDRQNHRTDVDKPLLPSDYTDLQIENRRRILRLQQEEKDKGRTDTLPSITRTRKHMMDEAT